MTRLRLVFCPSSVAVVLLKVDELAGALFEDAVKPGKEGISVDDLSDQFKKHKGLLENLTLSIGESCDRMF